MNKQKKENKNKLENLFMWQQTAMCIDKAELAPVCIQLLLCAFLHHNSKEHDVNVPDSFEIFMYFINILIVQPNSVLSSDMNMKQNM